MYAYSHTLGEQYEDGGDNNVIQVEEVQRSSSSSPTISIGLRLASFLRPSLERYSSPSPSHNANPDPKLGKKIEKEKGA
jgi:hypothetical protein